MQTQYNPSNLLNAINDLLQLWYFRLLLCGALLFVVSVVAYVIILHLTSSALQAGPCNPLCAPVG